MKKTLPLIFMFFSIKVFCADKDSSFHYMLLLPDSVKAVQYLAEINVKSFSAKKELAAGISTEVVKVYLESDKKEREIVFEYPSSAQLVASGLNTTKEKGELTFSYSWSPNENYKLLISQATDSAGNFSLYSGYAFLPKENKWKLLGTCKINGRWNTIQQPELFYKMGTKDLINFDFSQAWVQRSTGGWKNLKPGSNLPNPQINLSGHVDSVLQRMIDVSIIYNAIKKSQLDTKENEEGVFYKIIKTGTGRQVTVNDTVTVFYHVSLFNDTTTVDEAKDKPAVFPLKRLIRGWQIGVPLCNVGGKIRLIIPSDLAYSIRTRSPDIPPNSILDFEIEVVEAKSPDK